MSSRTCLIAVALVGIAAWSCVLGLQRPPPRYSQQYMPDTAFNCRNKIVGSYYADPETDCQLFHVCVSVAGSIQDYKFLCPNDTAFDQESQTCADWYDVDCEAATLYYASDNFDLYRLGSGLESLHYDSVRSDAEPQDNLQRSETSDAVRSSANYNRANENNNNNANSRDILRGSSSVNFYNSRNGGKDEDYENEKTYEPVQEAKRKNGVRKIARKQPANNGDNANNNYAASSTIAPVIASSPTPNNYNNGFYNNNNNKNYNRQRTSSFPSSTTPSAAPQDNYNARNQNNQKYNSPTTTYRPSTAQQTYSSYQSPSTTPRTTAYNNNNNNYNYNSYNTNQQQTSNSYGESIVTSPKTTSYSQNYPTTARTTIYNQNYQEQQNYNEQYSQFGQNTRTQSSTVQPSTNYQSVDYTNYQRNYNNIQRTTSSPNTFPTTPAPTTYYNGYNTNNGQYNANAGQYNAEQYNNNNNKQPAQSSTRQATQTSKYFPNYTGSSYAPTTYSPATKKIVNNPTTNNNNGQYNTQSVKTSQFNDSTRTPKKPIVNEDVTNQPKGRGVDRYNAQTTGNDNGQYNPQSVKSTQYYDSTRAPKKATQYNGNYDITNNGKYYESSTANYDIARSQAGIGFSPSSINLLAETPRTTTPVPKRTGGPTTYNPISFNANNQRQTQTTPRATTLVSGSARPFTTTARLNDATTSRPKSGKKNDYDYAYYDNTGGLEYDGLDLEHVVAGNKESSKISRN